MLNWLVLVVAVEVHQRERVRDVCASSDRTGKCECGIPFHFTMFKYTYFYGEEVFSRGVYMHTVYSVHRELMYAQHNSTLDSALSFARVEQLKL